MPDGGPELDVDGCAVRFQVVAVVPVKPLLSAKSRLAVSFEHRRALALAFALDTIAAVSGSPLVAGVLVVTSDPEIERCLREHPVRLVPDGGAGLRAAVRAGCRAASGWQPATGVAVVPADLPCLLADDVTRVLTSAQAVDAAFVPDRASSGTTLLAYAPGRPALPQYGPESAARHQALGLRRLDDAPVRARHDVDTIEDLQQAAALGLGPATAAALAVVQGEAAAQHAS